MQRNQRNQTPIIFTIYDQLTLTRILKMILPIFFTFSLLFSLSYANTIAFDFCVGDLNLPSGPSGFSCKDPTKVTADDFVYSGMRVASNTSNLFKFGIRRALSPQFPGLNGLGISIARADFDVGGFFPMHTHRTSEILMVTEGTLMAGFIDTNNKAYYKTLMKEDIMIIPPTLVHFMINVGSTPVLAYTIFTSANPGVQILDTSLFQNSLPSEMIEKVTLLDHAQVTKLKKIFGDTDISYLF